MVSEHQTAGDNLTINNEQSHLLKLPPEVRLMICEYALASGKNKGCHLCVKPRRPSLEQVCRQLRNETRVMYYERTAFKMVISLGISNYPDYRTHLHYLRRWAAILAADELRKISSLEFYTTTLSARELHDFGNILSDMIRRGLNTSALRFDAGDNRIMQFEADW